MITGVINNEFYIGDSIEINCSLALFGGPDSLNEAKTNPESIFDHYRNGVAAIELIRHTGSAEREIIATYSAYSGNKNFVVLKKIIETGSFSFTGKASNNRSISFNNTESFTMKLSVAKASCSDQAKYICRFMYHDFNGGFSAADYHQHITAVAPIDDHVHFHASPDLEKNFVADTIEFECKFKAPAGMTLQWWLQPCDNDTDPSYQLFSKDESFFPDLYPSNNSCVQHTYHLKLNYTVSDKFCNVMCVAGPDTENRNIAIKEHQIVAKANKTIVMKEGDGQDDRDGDGDDVNVGMIAGIVVGAIAVIVIILLATYYFYCKQYCLKVQVGCDSQDTSPRI